MTRTQIGHVLQDSYGDEFLVYLHQYADEEPNEVQITGRACEISFDPSSPDGRAGILALIERLHGGLDEHERACQLLYGELQVGDYCYEIREPVDDEPRCDTYMWEPGGQFGVQCSRVDHFDAHHVAIDDDCQVIAVSHPQPPVLVVPDETAQVFGLPVATKLGEQLLSWGRKSWMS